jgi:hypothetical protein
MAQKNKREAMKTRETPTSIIEYLQNEEFNSERFEKLLNEYDWKLGTHIEKETGNALMHYAAIAGNTDAINFLVLEGESVLINARNAAGQTPLILSNYHHGASNETSQLITGQINSLELEQAAIASWAADMGSVLDKQERHLDSWYKEPEEGRRTPPPTSRVVVAVTPLGEVSTGAGTSESPFPLTYSLDSLGGGDHGEEAGVADDSDGEKSIPETTFTEKVRRKSTGDIGKETGRDRTLSL